MEGTRAALMVELKVGELVDRLVLSSVVSKAERMVGWTVVA